MAGRGAKSDPLTMAIPFFLGSLALEAWMLRGERAEAKGMAGFEKRDTAASLAMGVGNLAVNTALAGAVAKVDDALRKRRVVDVGGGALGWAVAMVGWDLCYYLEHRYSHRVRLGWANHVSHHSSQRYNLSTALRQPWSGYLAHWCYAPLPLLGVPARHHYVSGSINLIYQFWIHTEVIDRMPRWFEKVFNTPSHHRVHHGSNKQYLDKNYAGILILWDRWFNSFEPEDEPVIYGLTKNIDSFNPAVIGYHEFVDIGKDVRRSPGLKQKLKAIFGPPGAVG